MSDQFDISALIGSRICHDLISPIGAIGNGVELLLLEGTTQGPEMALVGESVASANARIRFFRVAYGLASNSQRLGRPEIVDILSDVTKGSRLSVEWQIPTDVARGDAKMAFLAIQCLETAMAFGGRIFVAIEGDRWVMTGQSTRMKIDPALWERLSNPKSKSEITPALVQFLLLPEQVATQNRRLSVELRDTEIRMVF